MRDLLGLSIALLLCACPSTNPGGTADTGSETESTDDDDDSGNTEPMETSTSTTTTSGTTMMEVDSSGGEASSSGGLTLGCTPGDPCCNDEGQFEECWIDNNTGLVWELIPGGGNPTVADALAYCDQLVLVESAGWRLPSLDELRTLVRGCGATNPAGACGLTDDCADQDCRTDECDGCELDMGPHMFGCYWDPNLQGTCDRYWSTTNTGTGLGWLIDYNDASVRQADGGIPAGLVRCVAN